MNYNHFLSLIQPRIKPIFLLLFSFSTIAQTYQPERTRTWDLLHTELHVKPIFSSKTLEGKAFLTLKPWFYEQSILELDARGFDIESIKNQANENLKFKYDKHAISIDLGKKYARNDTLKIQIQYVAKPYELEKGGSGAISSDQGLYFIEDKSKQPIQFWTQGETQSNSAWFPTIDSPNEKHTQEIFITVDDKFVTLSNGLLINQKLLENGTRIDHWRQTLPHAPYLTMIAGGDFVIVKDDPHQGKEISYYIEPKYQQNAKAIFGRTKAMMTFFEQKLGVPYQWDKYSQITVRNFVSGAMENTSAVVHGDFVEKDPHELIDKNDDLTIAHELFHHWFGDLATCESWANLPLNEAFANYSEYLWLENAHGKNEADLHRREDLEGYLYESETKQEPLIRFVHADREEMFDAHSYNKGGAVLHMLRTLVGDEAFYESLRVYLLQNQFKTVEIHDLRKAFEQVTGQDLNWFFEQWFLRAGHPELLVTTDYSKQKFKIKIKQTQSGEAFKIPLKIAIWQGDSALIVNEILEEKETNLEYDFATKPSLVIADAETQLLGKINHKKTKEEYLIQMELATSILSKIEAMDSLSQRFGYDKKIMLAIQNQLNNPFWRLRESALDAIVKNQVKSSDGLTEQVLKMAQFDKHQAVRSKAISMLNEYGGNVTLTPILLKSLEDTSYAVRAEALKMLMTSAYDDLPQLIEIQRKTPSGTIQLVIAEYLSKEPKDSDYQWFVDGIRTQKLEVKYEMVQIFAKFLLGIDELQRAEGVKILVGGLQDASAYVRFGAFQALILYSDEAEVKKAMLNAAETEKDVTLRSIFNQLKGSLD